MAAKQERLKKELLAQRARAEAVRHLESTGSGPSQRELARQQQDRRLLQSATAARVERFLGSSASSGTAPISTFDPRVRDNTLHALARRRADELQQEQQQQTRGRRSGALPEGWTEVRDPASGDAYYWNERTNETSWERPGRRARGGDGEEGEEAPEAESTTGAAATGESDLPAGWESVTDPTSGDAYFWNQNTNETSWTRPAVTKDVILEEALAAKSKLDAILKSCGPASSGSKRARSDESATAPTTKRSREEGTPSAS